MEKRHILWVFWDNKNITELCEKWICCYGNYAYRRFEELRTYSGETILRTKKEYKDMLDMINNKISKINGVNKMREKIRKKIELIYQSMFKLHDDLWLRLADLNKMDVIIDDEINFIWYRLKKQNKLKQD